MKEAKPHPTYRIIGGKEVYAGICYCDKNIPHIKKDKETDKVEFGQ